MSSGEGFFSRWSQRKVQVRQGEAPPEPVHAVVPAPAKPPAPPAITPAPAEPTLALRLLKTCSSCASMVSIAFEPMLPELSTMKARL